MLTFSSRKLVLNLEAVKARYTGRKVSARITVPPNLDWWFYQEFGTATHFNEDTIEMPPGVLEAALPASTKPSGYQIIPNTASFITLPITGQYSEEWVGPVVNHPGVSPKAYIRRILPEIYKQSVLQVATALVDSGYEPDAVQEALMSEVMPSILVAITESMASLLNASPDRESPGKLGPQSPSDAFNSAATIVDSSGE